MKKTHQVCIPVDVKPRPSEREISAAMIIAEFFEKDVTCIKRGATQTADFLIGNQIWEHKCPVGEGKRTMQNNLRAADNQSCFVIIDLRFCKMRQDQALNRLRYEMSKATKVKRLVVIQKNGKVLEIK